VTIAYDLFDEERDPCSVSVELSIDGGVSFVAATLSSRMASSMRR